MAEKENLSTVPFNVVERNLNYLEINLSEDMEDLCNENLKAFKKRNRRRHWKIHVPGLAACQSKPQ